MRQMRQDKYRKKLKKMLSLSDNFDVIIMFWACHAIQTGRSSSAIHHIEFRNEVISEDLSSKYAIHPWRIETIINELLVTKKKGDAPGAHMRRLDCSKFTTAQALTQALGRLENEEDGISLKRANVDSMMHRLGQRQFEWQRGFISQDQMYRSAYIYSGKLAEEYFNSEYGITIQKFALAAFVFRSYFMQLPSMPDKFLPDDVGLSEDEINIVRSMLSISEEDAATKLGESRTGRGHTAYKPSILRTHPIIKFRGRGAVAVLPDLVIHRALSGIFYDVIDGGDRVKNEIAFRFEDYCRNFMQSMLGGLSVLPPRKYKIRKGHEIDTPDIRLARDGLISLVVECKATRMSYGARYAEEPLKIAARGYDELAKGVYQIWRYTSHCRRGIMRDEVQHKNTTGLLVTLDAWLVTGGVLRQDVLRRAREMVAEKNEEIIQADLVPIIFCNIDDLEDALCTSTVDSFFSAVISSAEPRFEGCSLQEIHNNLFPGRTTYRESPLTAETGNIWPWWSELQAE